MAAGGPAMGKSTPAITMENSSFSRRLGRSSCSPSPMPAPAILLTKGSSMSRSHARISASPGPWISGLVLAALGLALAGGQAPLLAQQKVTAQDLLGLVMEGDAAKNKDIQKAIDD